jgi:hypothetical protein
MHYKVRFVDYLMQYQNMKNELDETITEVISNGKFFPKEKLRISRLPKELGYDDKLWLKWEAIVNAGNE